MSKYSNWTKEELEMHREFLVSKKEMAEHDVRTLAVEIGKIDKELTD